MITQPGGEVLQAKGQSVVEYRQMADCRTDPLPAAQGVWKSANEEAKRLT